MNTTVMVILHNLISTIKGKNIMRTRAAAFTILLTLVLTACAVKPVDEPPTWQEQYDLGVRYLSEGNYEEAIIAFSAAIGIDPKQAENYLGLTELYILNEEYDKALSTLQQGLEEIPDSEELKAKLQEVEESNSDFSRYVTAQLISEEEFVIGNVPFYSLSLEDAIEQLPQSNSFPRIEEIPDENGNIAVRRYTVFREGVGGIITCEQLVSSNTLSGLMFSDYYKEKITGVETGIKGIKTGDSMRNVLEKIGVSFQGARLLEETGMSVMIGANHTIEGGYGWIEAEDNMVSVNAIPAKIIDIMMDTCNCQMNFIDNKLVLLHIWVSH